MARGSNQSDHDVSLRALLRLAGPVVLSRLGIMAMGLVDTVVVGRHSATELGYLVLAWAPTAVVLTTAIGLLGGVQVMTSQAIGAGRRELTGAILRRGLVYAFWLGLAAAAVLAGLGGPLMHAFGLAPGLADGATPVLRVLAVSMLPILIADAGMFWLEAQGKPVPAMTIMWGANLVNLALNLWLVPGGSGLPVEGAVASAWSTAGARTALMVGIIGYIAWWPGARAIGVRTRAPRDPAAAAEMRRVGYGASGSYFIETSAFGTMSIIAGLLGATAVAAWGNIINAAAVIFMVPLGLSAATAVLVGRAHGAGSLGGVRRAGVVGFGATLAATLAICAVVGFGNELIAEGYTRDPAVRALTAAALLLSCLFFVADGLQVVFAQALRAQGDVWIPTVTHTIAYLVVMMPLGYGLAIGLGWGVPGIIWAVIVASLVSAGLLLGRFWWRTKLPSPSGEGLGVGESGVSLGACPSLPPGPLP